MKKLILILVLFVPSCAYQKGADGSKSFSVDAAGLARVIDAVK